MLSLQSGWQAVRLVEPGSRVVVNTAVPFGEPSALVNDDWVRAVRDTKRPAVSSMRRDPATDQFFVSIGVPVMRDGPEVRLRARRAHPRRGVQRRAAAAAGAGRRRRRADGRRTDDHGEDARRGASTSAASRTPTSQRPSAQHRKARCDRPCSKERRRFRPGADCRLTGWTVGIGLPAAAVDGPILESLLLLITVGVAILGGGLLMTFVVRWRIVRAQVAAVTAARALARGEPTARWTRGSPSSTIWPRASAMRARSSSDA